MAFSFIPKEVKFFDLFDQQAEKMIESSRLLTKLIDGNGFNAEGVKEMAVVEHQCDDLTHDIIDKLNKTFITPL